MTMRVEASTFFAVNSSLNSNTSSIIKSSRAFRVAAELDGRYSKADLFRKIHGVNIAELSVENYKSLNNVTAFVGVTTSSMYIPRPMNMDNGDAIDQIATESVPAEPLEPIKEAPIYFVWQRISQSALKEVQSFVKESDVKESRELLNRKLNQHFPDDNEDVPSLLPYPQRDVFSSEQPFNRGHPGVIYEDSISENCVIS